MRSKADETLVIVKSLLFSQVKSSNKLMGDFGRILIFDSNGTRKNIRINFIAHDHL